MKKPSPDELERLYGLHEYCREFPEFLPWLEQNRPEVYRQAVKVLRALAAEASRAEWRHPNPEIGARPEQLMPGTPGSFSDRKDWVVWLLMGGRGSGKSHAGAMAIVECLLGRAWSTRKPKVGLVGQTLDAVRLDMVENKLLPLLPPGSIIRWNRGPCELWLQHPDDPTCRPYLKGFSAETPRKARGPEHHLLWCDEIGTWGDSDQSPQADDTTWSNLVNGLRLEDASGWQPKAVVTTTPRSVKLIRNLEEDDPLNPGPGLYDDPETTVVSHMSTYDNEKNLAEAFIRKSVAPKAGTRLHKQEIEGQLLDERKGSLWSYELVERMERKGPAWPWKQAGGLKKTIVAVDPSVGAGDGDECGIVVLAKGDDGRAYIMEDASMRGHPSEWVPHVVRVFEQWSANYVVAEVNQGYELVTEVLGLTAPNLPVYPVTAKVNKQLRAEPVALLSDQDRVRIACACPRLAHQMRNWNPEEDKESPDRLDAMVYGVLDLLPPHDVDALIGTKRGRGRR